MSRGKKGENHSDGILLWHSPLKVQGVSHKQHHTLIDLLIYSLIDRSIDWLIYLFIYLFIGWLVR